jgi:glutamine amidotransferase
MKQKVAIISSIGSNLASLKYALDRLDINYIETEHPQKIINSSHVILPGVGSAKKAIETLKNNDLIEVIPLLTQPTLGICLGMQLLMQSSSENNSECLGVIEGNCKSFVANSEHPVPHMGWNRLNFDYPMELTRNINDGEYFYFVHSYYVPIVKETTGMTEYDFLFSSMIQKDNFYGTQFHPEKSGLQGSTLLTNFFKIK